MTTLEGAFGSPFYRNSASGLTHILRRQPSQVYILMLFILVPHVRSLTFNPVSMTDANTAKEYGYGTAALACTVVSLLASMLCMYWFCRMEKRFRHRSAI